MAKGTIVGGSSARYCFSVAWSIACWCMLVLCGKLNVSGNVLFLCSGLDDRRSARPMTGDGRKRGGMWSFDVKLSGAPKCSCSSCRSLQLQVPACQSGWCGTLRAPAEMLCCAFPIFEHHLVVVYRQEYHRYHHANCKSSRDKMHVFLLAGMER